MGVPFALLHVAPLRRDDTQSLLAVARCATLGQPAPNDKTRSANPAATVDSADPPTSLVVSQGCKDAIQEVNRLGEAAVSDGEAVIFDGGGLDSEDNSSLGEDALVRQQFPVFCQVNEGPNAYSEEVVELGLAGVFGRPGVFASDEVGSSPVGVW